MFPFHFHHIHICIHHSSNFYFSHTNHFSLTLNILDNENTGLGKYNGWLIIDLNPRSWPWHLLTKICFSASLSENHSSNRYTVWFLYSIDDAYLLIKFWRIPLQTIFGNFCSQFHMCFSKAKQTIGHMLGMVGPTGMKQKWRTAMINFLFLWQPSRLLHLYTMFTYDFLVCNMCINL